MDHDGLAEEIRRRQELERLALEEQLATVSPESAVPGVAAPVAGPEAVGFFEGLYNDPGIQQQANNQGLRNAGLALLQGAASTNYADTLARALAAYDTGRESTRDTLAKRAFDDRNITRQEEADARAERATGRADEREARYMRQLEASQSAAAAKAKTEEEKKLAAEEKAAADKAAAMAALDAVRGRMTPENLALAERLAERGDLSGVARVINDNQRDTKPPKADEATVSEKSSARAKEFLTDERLSMLTPPQRQNVLELYNGGQYEDAYRAWRGYREDAAEPKKAAGLTADQKKAMKDAGLPDAASAVVSRAMAMGYSLEEAIAAARAMAKRQGAG